jgi:PASTA domain
LLSKIYSRGLTALLLLFVFLTATIAASAQRQPNQIKASPVLVQTKPTPNPALVQLNRAESAVAITVVPELYWHSQREAEVTLQQTRLQFKVSGEGPIVVSQEPLPGTKAPAGSAVAITLGQPQLLLSADPLSAKINTDVSFTATLEPPLPKATTVTTYAYVPSRLQARYTYLWGDNSQIGPINQDTQPHQYGSAGTYNAVATALVGNYQIKSNPVTITIPNPTQVTPAYKISLKVEPQVADVGQDVRASIAVEPSPGPGTTYRFDWGDGKQEVRSSPDATHQYQPPARKRAIHATVTINNHEFHSNPVAIAIRTVPVGPAEQPGPEPTPSRWPLIVGIVVAIILLAAGYRLFRRGRKSPLQHLPPGLSITSKRGVIQHEIRNPEKIRKVAGVRIVSGCTSSTSMTPPGGIKKRSASNA